MFIVWCESVEVFLVVGILYVWLKNGDVGVWCGIFYLWGGVVVGVVLVGVLGVVLLGFLELFLGDV